MCNSCRKSFAVPSALAYHKRNCQPSKRRLHGALARVKELWESRKKPRLCSESTALEQPTAESSQNLKAPNTTSSCEVQLDSDSEPVPIEVCHGLFHLSELTYCQYIKGTNLSTESEGRTTQQGANISDDLSSAPRPGPVVRIQVLTPSRTGLFQQFNDRSLYYR